MQFSVHRENNYQNVLCQSHHKWDLVIKVSSLDP